MVHQKLILGTATVFCIACVARVTWRLCYLAADGEPSWVKAQGVVCDHAVFDFGTKRTGQVVEHVFYLRNSGTDCIDISSVRPGCSCVTTQLEEKTIRPRCSVPLKVAFSLDGLRGDVEKDIIVQSSDSANRFMLLKLKGCAQSEFNLKPNAVRFSKVYQGQALNDKIDIQVNGSGAFHLQSVACDSLLLEVRQESVVPGKEYRVHLKTKGDLPAGLWQTKVRIRTDNQKEPEIVVPVVAAVEARPQAGSSR
jgi:Protein of unknown function (DUF1573)